MPERMHEADLTILVAATLAAGTAAEMGPAGVVAYYRQVLARLRAPGAPITEDSNGNTE